MVERKCDVYVISEYRKEFEGQWKKVKSRAKVRYSSRYPFFPNIGFVWMFFRFFITNRKAIWIASGSKSLTLLGVGLYFSRRKSLAILHGHEMLENHGLKSRLSKRCLKYFTKAVAVSAFSKENSRPYFDEGRIEVIPNGFNQAKFNPVKKQKIVSQNLNLLTVGRISERKGQHNVINALPLIIEKHPGVCYHMVGISPEKNKLMAQILASDLQNHVRFHGVLSDQNLSSLLNRTDIFFMLSENRSDGDVEGFGIALIEANYFGVPTIGSLGCGIEQAIKDGYNGKLVPFNDPTKIAAAIDEILANYEAYSINSRAWSQDHFWSSIINRYLKVLSSL
ncbi:MAG TPA: glycosyltransferase [Cytophagales bacterium]|nr:glycosyltransferase [Cytophagales bacterium]HCR53826.1 glycosyltransferase [Cytophagales bacterium]